jgi:hypothetical protein
MKKESGLVILGVIAGVVGTYVAIKHKEEIKGKFDKLEKKIKEKTDKLNAIYSEKVMKVAGKVASKVYREPKKEEENINNKD